MKKQFEKLNNLFTECTYKAADDGIIFKTAPKDIEATKLFFDMVIEYAPIYMKMATSNKDQNVTESLDITIQYYLSDASANPQVTADKRKNLDNKIPGIPQDILTALLKIQQDANEPSITEEKIAACKDYRDKVLQCVSEYYEYIPNMDYMKAMLETFDSVDDKYLLHALYSAKDAPDEFIKDYDSRMDFYQSYLNDRQKDQTAKPRLTTPTIGKSTKTKEEKSI